MFETIYGASLDCGYGTDYEVTKIKHIRGKNRVISLGGRSNPGVCRQQGNGWSPNKSRCKHILEDLYDILKNLERMSEWMFNTPKNIKFSDEKYSENEKGWKRILKGINVSYVRESENGRMNGDMEGWMNCKRRNEWNGRINKIYMIHNSACRAKRC